MKWPKSDGVSSSISLSFEGSIVHYYHHNPIVNPLVNGFLAGTTTASLICGSNWLHRKYTNFNLTKSVLRMELLRGATMGTASLGVFEIFRNKVKQSNNGKPLTLYQEAYCGVAAALTGAFVLQPFERATLYQTVRNEGMLALWKGGGYTIGPRIALNTGMLASYYPTRNYLIQSANFSEPEAQIVSGIVSGFSAAVCSQPFWYLKAVRGGTPIKEILTPYSGFKFYSSSLKNLYYFPRFFVVQWMFFELLQRSTEGLTKSTEGLTT